MFVVRRSFRNYGEMLLPGSVVEPDSIKRFKTRVKDRFIIEVNAHNFEYYNVYFKEKFGVTLPSIIVAKTEEPVVPEEPEATKAPEVPEVSEEPKVNEANEEPKRVVVKAVYTN